MSSDRPTPTRAIPRQATSAVAHVAPSPEDDDPLLAFAPYLHTHPRRNSITPELQRKFVATLAATGIVTQAARSIGKSMEALYKLRHRPGAEGFAAAWDAALERGVQRLEDCALERALKGTPTPIVSGGKLLGTWDKPDNTLLRFLLQYRLPAKYSPAVHEVKPGHPVWEELAAQAEREIAEMKRELRTEVTARAIALQTYRARRRAAAAKRLGEDAPTRKDLWEGEVVDGVPQLPRWGDPELFEKVEECLADMERRKPYE